jgi:hypothetical protein
MKRTVTIIALTLLFTVIAVFAQKPLVVKDSAASQFLNQLARDHAANQAVFNTKLQQARVNLDQSNKALQEQIVAAQKDLDAKLKEDKKYKPIMDQITSLQEKFNDNSKKANEDFQKEVGTIPQKIQTEASQIEGLIDVVKKENSLPADAIYDQEKQTWTEPAPKPEKK